MCSLNRCSCLISLTQYSYWNGAQRARARMRERKRERGREGERERGREGEGGGGERGRGGGEGGMQSRSAAERMNKK